MGEDQLNLGDVVSRLGLDQSKVVVLLRLFLDTSESDFERLRAAVENSDPTAAVEAAHSIKGAAMGLDLKQIADIATRIEQIAMSGTVQGIAEHLPELAARLQEMTDYLTADGS